MLEKKLLWGRPKQRMGQHQPHPPLNPQTTYQLTLMCPTPVSFDTFIAPICTKSPTWKRIRNIQGGYFFHWVFLSYWQNSSSQRGPLLLHWWSSVLWLDSASSVIKGKLDKSKITGLGWALKRMSKTWTFFVWKSMFIYQRSQSSLHSSVLETVPGNDQSFNCL